ncbi:hypothetical protein V7S43_008158 [Phytophthora oleae]|uniref:ZNF598/HEL2 PAH domain-containing protein n=1 Tax=Phytophthora oleae TaxID=2107226 RepID=A0ABD3FHX9_9STRA
MERDSSLADFFENRYAKTVTPGGAPFCSEAQSAEDDKQSPSFVSMASRPLLPGRPGNVTRSPVRPKVALRWTNNVAAAPIAPKVALSPVKRWPPPKVEAPLQAPGGMTLASEAAPQPAVEKKTAVSAFQSARAVFEAKKTFAAAPPPPPIGHSFRFPAQAPPSVEKQHSATSDLSASSCSTLNSESDRKLEESVAVNHKPESSSPVHVVVKKMEEEFARDTHSGQVALTELPYHVDSVPPSPAKVGQAPPPQNTMTVNPSQEKASNQNEIDPFRLLLPVDSIPRLPHEITCVYDEAAIEMEKNIKKVVRKLLKKDKVQLEEFKVNSRLFGTDFMDAHAYLETLVKNFGSIRALQLVPCLLSIQPNLVKSNALLLTAKNYLLRNEEDMKRELQRLQLLSSKKIAGFSANTDTEATPATVEVCGGNAIEVSSVAITKATPPVDDVVFPTSGCAISVPAQIGTAQPPPLKIVPVLMAESAQQPGTEKVKSVTESKTVEPMPEPQVVIHAETPPPLLNIAVSAPSRKTTTAPMQKLAPTPVANKPAELEMPIDAEKEFIPENLFGETFKLISPGNKQKAQQTGVPAAPISPASSVHSFDEAESLFGERLSPSSRTSSARRKTVTWGDTQTVEVPVPDKVSVVKTAKKPAPLLFGLATAAAFESDENESDFSD